MRASRVLQKTLSDSLTTMHQARSRVLLRAVRVMVPWAREAYKYTRARSPTVDRMIRLASAGSVSEFARVAWVMRSCLVVCQQINETWNTTGRQHGSRRDGGMATSDPSLRSLIRPTRLAGVQR